MDACLIPYGVASWSISDLQKAGAGGATSRAPFPCTRATPGRTLRLNTHSLDHLPQDASTSGQLAALRDQALSLCPVWDRPSRDLLTAYFALIVERIEENRNALEQRLEPFAGLYRPDDWVFSAPLPLPRAHLFAPPEVPTGDERDYVAVDVAFWLAERIVAFVSDASISSPRRARERKERLARAKIACAAIPSADRGRQLEVLLRNAFRTEELSFWHESGLPSSPFRPRILT